MRINTATARGRWKAGPSPAGYCQPSENASNNRWKMPVRWGTPERGLPAYPGGS
jgi:hypothetical protein